MFDAIDNYARSIATKLSNWVLNLPFWPEGAVGERRLRYVLLGLLAAAGERECRRRPVAVEPYFA